MTDRKSGPEKTYQMDISRQQEADSRLQTTYYNRTDRSK